MKRFVLVNILLFIPILKATQLPENFKRCKPKDDDCLSNAIQGALRELCKNGLPKFNISTLDPIKIPEITLGTKGRAVDLVQKYSEVELYGFRNAIVSNSKLDLDKKILTFSTFLPELKHASKYNITGRILIIPIYGNGNCEVIQHNVTVVHTIRLSEEKRDKEVFFKVLSYTPNAKPQVMTFKFENLFNGNKILSDNIHKVVNENWPLIWGDSQRGFEEAYGQVYESIAERLFSRIPVDDIFLKLTL